MQPAARLLNLPEDSLRNNERRLRWLSVPRSAVRALLAALTVGLLSHHTIAADSVFPFLRGGCKGFPAIVNPVVRSGLRKVINLDGDWEFTIDPRLQGIKERWFLPKDGLPSPRAIKVPSAWEAQGIGQPGWSQPRNDPRRFAYEPVMERLRAAYTGAAWYRREVHIPGDWTGDHVWLKVGGVNARGWIWVNGHYVADNWAYCGTFKYDITDFVKPGKSAVVAILVRNDVPSRRGESTIICNYGGLVRSIEIEATPPVFIDHGMSYATPNFDKREVQLNVTLRNTSGRSVSALYSLQVVVRTWKGNKFAGQTNLICAVSRTAATHLVMGVALNPFHPWSPENPFLYVAQATLWCDGHLVDGWDERFGMKKFEVRDGHLYLNNHRYFLRGVGDDSAYPITVCSPASRAAQIRDLEKMKAYGFNYVRLHTHCEIPEYFQAADEVGMLIQPELPYWAPTNHMSKGPVDPKGDLRELVVNYRRYTSLATYCGGNEGNYGSPLGQELYHLAKKLDPTRPWISQDGGVDHRDNSGINVSWFSGSAQEHVPDSSNIWGPHVLHEYMSLGLNEDPRLAKKYTGAYLPNVTLAQAQRYVHDTVRLPWKWADRCLDAGYRLQGIYHKIGIETARLDPALDGFVCWLMVDLSPNSQNGVLNMFWDVKHSTPIYFHQFNAPAVILARKPNPKPGRLLDVFAGACVYSAGDKLSVEWVISNFAGHNFPEAIVCWKLVSGRKILATGATKASNVPDGAVVSIGTTTIRIPNVAHPLRARLRADLMGSKTPLCNSWDLYLFPRFVPQPGSGKGVAISASLYPLLAKRYPGAVQLDNSTATQADVIVTTDLEDRDVITALDAGKRIVSLALPVLPGAKLVSPGVKLGWWGTSGQTGTAIARSAAFGAFPQQGYLNQLWFRLMGTAERLGSGNAFASVDPLMVGTGSQHYIFGNGDIGGIGEWKFNLDVFQAKAGKGRLLASGLNLASNHPEAVYLLDRFLRYAKSDQFQPKGRFSLAPLRKAAEERRQMRKEVNGFAKVISTGLEIQEYMSFLGKLPMHIVRQRSGKDILIWQTRQVPKSLQPNDKFSFRWIASTGWKSQPGGGHFTLFLDDEELLQVGLSFTNRTWQSAHGRIKLIYDVKQVTDEDSDGIMTLTLPAGLLRPGEPAQLRVIGSASNSQRYFGLYEFP